MPSYKYTTKSGKNRWFCAFYCRSYSGENRKIKKSGFITKREADSYERDYLARRSGSASSMTIRQAAENYLDDLAARRKPKTVQNMRAIVTHHVIPVWGNQQLDAIKATDVREWENDLIRGGKYARSTIRYIVSAFSAIFAFSIRLYGLRGNPVQLAGTLQFTSPSTRERGLHFWTVPQFSEFISSGLKPEYILLFSILFWTGARLSEALALTLRDYDSAKQTLHINKTISIVPPKQKIIQSPKTQASNRTISIPRHLGMMLDDWIQQTDMRKSGDMFFWLAYEKAVESYFHNHAKRAGLPIIRIHDLRHSHASMLINMGFSATAVMARLGHSDIRTTMNIYSHLFPQTDEAIRKGLENAR